MIFCVLRSSGEREMILQDLYALSVNRFAHFSTGNWYGFPFTVTEISLSNSGGRLIPMRKLAYSSLP